MSELLVKVCGMTRAEDVTLCASLGVDMLGFIFHPPSPRCVTLAAAGTLKAPGPRRVGVFVHQDPDQVLFAMEEAALDMAQLHGDQDEDFCRAVGPERVVKVLWPQRFQDLRELEAALARFAPVCSYFLLDAGTSGGGHGTVLEARRLKGLQCPRPWLLAGGMGPDTLVSSLRACSPAGVDLNSGVEHHPGVKDPGKIRAALTRIQQYKDTVI